MSLQNALVFLGVVVIIGIYFVSTWNQKYKPLLANRGKKATKFDGKTPDDMGEDVARKRKKPRKDASSRASPERDEIASRKSIALGTNQNNQRRHHHESLDGLRSPLAGESETALSAPLSGNHRIQSREVVMDGWKIGEDDRIFKEDQQGRISSPIETDFFSDHALYEDESYRTNSPAKDVANPPSVAKKVGKSAPEGKQQDQNNVDDAPDSLPVIDFDYHPPEGFEKISQIDYWVKIAGERDVGRESVLGIYRDSISSITKKSNIYGLRLPERAWCDLEMESEEARFGDLVVTVQLADRLGPIKESEMTRFSVLVSNLSEGTGRGFSFMAPIESAMEQAAAIDSFVMHYNSVFIVNIKPRESLFFDGSVIQRCAIQIGLEKSEQNYFVRNKPVGRRNVCLYGLANMTDSGEFDFDDMNNQSIEGVTFFIKPPLIKSPGPVFAEMVDTAKAFASRVKGEVIVLGREDLSTDVVELIRDSIEDISSRMERSGISSGSEEATKIF